MSKSELKTYQVGKSRVKNDENRALQLAVQKTGLGSRFLKAEHTETMFVFIQTR